MAANRKGRLQPDRAETGIAGLVRAYGEVK